MPRRPRVTLATAKSDDENGGTRNAMITRGRGTSETTCSRTVSPMRGSSSGLPGIGGISLPGSTSPK